MNRSATRVIAPGSRKPSSILGPTEMNPNEPSSASTWMGSTMDGANAPTLLKRSRALASKDRSGGQHNEGSEEYPGPYKSGMQWEGRQADRIDIVKWHNGKMQGKISARIRVTQYNTWGGWCEKMKSIGGAVIGAFNGFAGGFFGLLTMGDCV